MVEAMATVQVILHRMQVLKFSEGLGIYGAETVVPIIGAIGLVSLAISWHNRANGSIRLAQLAGCLLVSISLLVRGTTKLKAILS